MVNQLTAKTMTISCVAFLACLSAARVAQAADLQAPTAPAPPPSFPTFALFEGVEYHAQFEGGIQGNASNPRDGQNIGQLSTDRSNTPELNQALFTVQKTIDPKAKDYAFGFAVQAIFGADERYNHVLGLGTSFIKGRNQLGLYNAYLAAHLPWLFDCGIDVKLGVFSSVEGLETTDPSTTPFYSHSYIVNYALDSVHTGLLTTTHVNSTLDVYLGVDTGTPTTFGRGDNNAEPGGTVGFGLNGLLDNKLIFLALSHMGPENPECGGVNGPNNPPGLPTNCDPTANRDMRYYNVIDVTYKFNDDWTSVTELNYTHDDISALSHGASAYGATEYISYALNKQVTLNARGEVFRDADGFFVVNYPGNLDAVALARGYACSCIFQPPTTYSEITLGLTYKPDVPKPLALLQIRPEVRYDRALSNNTPFGVNPATGLGTHKDQFLFGGDVVVGF